MVITARMGELYRESQGSFKKTKWLHSSNQKSWVRWADPLNTVYFSCWSSDCLSFVHDQLVNTASFGWIEDHREKEASVLCLN